MTDMVATAALMASLEVSPGQPSDLTPIVSSSVLRNLLSGTTGGEFHNELLEYVMRNASTERREYWMSKLLDLERLGGNPVLAGDANYPHLLSQCWDAPPVLFVNGQLTDPETPIVAVVGSRRTSSDVLTQAEAIGAAMAERGVCVVSGLAAGVDTAAHVGALTGRGRTIAVLGTGLGRTYPPENTSLAEEISVRGALVSQFSPQAPATRSTFLMRNHVIAGMARTSIVMDASYRSGSRYEATIAMDYGRRVVFWAPAMESEPWAVEDVARGRAVFASSLDEIVATV